MHAEAPAKLADRQRLTCGRPNCGDRESAEGCRRLGSSISLTFGVQLDVSEIDEPVPRIGVAAVDRPQNLH